MKQRSGIRIEGGFWSCTDCWDKCWWTWEREKTHCCFYPIVNRSEVNQPMPRYFLAVSHPNWSWSKEQLTGVRKGFQACNCSLALLFITVVFRLLHCVNIIYNQKNLKKNSVFQEIQLLKVFFTYFYELIQHYNVRHMWWKNKLKS